MQKRRGGERRRKKEMERPRGKGRQRGSRPRDREHSAGSSYSRDVTKISGRPFRNRSARVRPGFNIEHSRLVPSRKHHTDVDRSRVPSLSLFSLPSLSPPPLSLILSSILSFLAFLSSLSIPLHPLEKNVSFFPLRPSRPPAPGLLLHFRLRLRLPPFRSDGRIDGRAAP